MHQNLISLDRLQTETQLHADSTRGRQENARDLSQASTPTSTSLWMDGFTRDPDDNMPLMKLVSVDLG